MVLHTGWGKHAGPSETIEAWRPLFLLLFLFVFFPGSSTNPEQKLLAFVAGNSSKPLGMGKLPPLFLLRSSQFSNPSIWGSPYFSPPASITPRIRTGEAGDRQKYPEACFPVSRTRILVYGFPLVVAIPKEGVRDGPLSVCEMVPVRWIL